MVSSEAESEGSVISEQRPQDGEPALTNDNSITDTNTLQDKSAPTLTATDWRNVGNTLASIVSTRGNVLYLYNNTWDKNFLYPLQTILSMKSKSWYWGEIQKPNIYYKYIKS